MTIGRTAKHRPLLELERLYAAFPVAPRPNGPVELIVQRPTSNERSMPLVAELDVQRGLVGDRWHGSDRTRDAQITLIDVRVAHALGERGDWELAGDNFVVDLDLDMETLAPGRTVRLGSARIEITAEPHLGCKKFSSRFGRDALTWVNDKARRHLRLRGVHARVLEPGFVHVGDQIALD